MSLPYARTYDEAYLVMNLRPCVCGETELADRTSSAVTLGGEDGERFSGHCVSCGRHRRFTFRMRPTEPGEIDFEVRFGRGDEPSRLIDAGEWLGVAELYGQVAAERLAEGEPVGDDVASLHHLLVSAAEAVGEVLKFLPPDAEEVPEGAFWSPGGRQAYEIAPERFTRAALRNAEGAARRRSEEYRITQLGTPTS